ncbi:ABC transporter permease [Trebonia sp.]|uniref:ABC transporter permease n=1 Tax=Trebonia sp. TaxID=2767075 RepID=UPI00261E4950|nr:ABC transporter permease [Trebonia sp.]
MSALSPGTATTTPERGFSALSDRHSRILVLLGKRLIQIPMVLFVVSIMTFWLVQLVPGDPGRNALGPYATQAQVHAWDVSNGLTGPVVARYLRWLGGFCTGNWGTSFVYLVPCRGLVLGHLVNSMLLGLYGFVLMVPLSIALGSVQAYREGRRSDRAITISLMSLSSVPEFVVGVLLLVVFAAWLKMVPVQSSADATGDLPQRLHAMTLPAVVLAIAYLAVLSRMVRTGTAGAITAQFHRTAVLKGLPPAQIVRRHVTRNALIPTMQLLGLYLGALLGGNAVVETLFNYPGLGALLVVAAEHKDVVLLTDAVMVTGVVSLLALLLTDVCLILMDPRIRFENTES